MKPIREATQTRVLLANNNQHNEQYKKLKVSTRDGSICMSSGNTICFKYYANPDGSRHFGEALCGAGAESAYVVSALHNGDIYAGYYRNSKREGHGEYIYKNGDRYRGNWKNDQYDGYGSMTRINESRYEGYLNSGRSDEYIISIHLDDGNIHAHTWPTNGRRCYNQMIHGTRNETVITAYGNGRGIYAAVLNNSVGDAYETPSVYANDEAIYVSTVNNEGSGNNVQSTSTNGGTIYTGTWISGRRHRHSERLTFDPVGVYEGSWVNNDRLTH
jgi:hypothetical protein